jgi:hypothetical protein
MAVVSMLRRFRRSKDGRVVFERRAGEDDSDEGDPARRVLFAIRRWQVLLSDSTAKREIDQKVVSTYYLSGFLLVMFP